MADRYGDPTPLRISSTEAERVLGWRAGTTFSDGLDELLAHEDAAAVLVRLTTGA